MRPTAQQLNDHLSSGGVVQVTTYGKSTLYTKKHSGWFADRGNNLYVRRGRSWDCLTFGDILGVSIRLGRYE